MKTKTASPGKPQSKVTIERLHKLLGNLVRTYNLKEAYVDDVDPFMGILSEAAFAAQSIYHRMKEKSRSN